MTELERARYRKIIEALLTNPSNEAAFQEAGISHAKGYALLRNPEFMDELRLVANHTYDATMNRLSGAAGKAFEVLLQCMDSKNDNVRARAVLGYFTLMSNPKLTHNDAEIQELREAIQMFTETVKRLPPSVRQAFKETMDAVQGNRKSTS
ncbi:hypothetical protein [Alicyclobacillus fastidiosus]|uniref:HEAT repeat domain-containing protein n=1 Tax=Alicyclobacillus fastidiosus TaxID=392011 RepID=A0ABV5ALB1_9BACL